MASFLVRWGTFQGGPSLVFMTGAKVRGYNLPSTLCNWLNQPASLNALTNLDLGPDGHFVLQYRRKDGKSACLKSPGLENFLGIPTLTKHEVCSFAWGDSSVIVNVSDLKSGQSRWYWRNLPQSLVEFMAKHQLQFNNNIHEFDLGPDGTWMLMTGTQSGYLVGESLQQKLRMSGNTLRPGFSLSKSSAEHFYLECPAPYLFAPSAWITEVKDMINDPAIKRLAQGYYDEKKQKVYLDGKAASNDSGFRGVFASPDVIANGLGVLNTSMSLLLN